MIHPDAFRTVVKTAQGDYRDRGSKFPSYLIPCASLEDLKVIIDQIKKDHPSGRHFCYAAIIGSLDQTERSSDDGEPSGTAGLPILNQLLSAELTNVVLLVVRYFGGTKLGKPGLINAYKESSASAIAAAKIITKYNRTMVCFEFEYDATGAVMQAIEQLEHASIVNQHYSQKCKLNVLLPNSVVEGTLHLFDHTDEVDVFIPCS